jgi:hypothetical protein
MMRSGVILLVEENRNEVELTLRAFESKRRHESNRAGPCSSALRDNWGSTG